jgi:restriction system protein
MPIPDYETMMLPILQYLEDRNTKSTRDVINHVIERFEISDEEQDEIIPSGRAKLLDNRVGWACTYMRKAGLIDSPSRGNNTITDDGILTIASMPKGFGVKHLKTFKKFQGFTATKVINPTIETTVENQLTPEEIIGSQSTIITDELKDELAERLAQMDPKKFESLVVDLVLAMGYGGNNLAEAGKAIGKSNDGGVDGLVNEDSLGLDVIYIQAKRWKGVVPIKEIRDFGGALMAKKSNKGIFITTSDFPESARDYVRGIEKKIVLINGEMLCELMVRHNLGVSVKTKLEIKQIDSEYFV